MGQEAVQQEAAALPVLEAASGRSAEPGSDSAALDSRSAAGLGPAPGSSAEPGSASSDARAPMALEPAVEQEAVEQEAAEDVEEPGSEEPGSDSSDAEAIMAFKEAEAVRKEAAALLQEPPDVPDADWGGGAAGSPVADLDDFPPRWMQEMKAREVEHVRFRSVQMGSKDLSWQIV